MAKMAKDAGQQSIKVLRCRFYLAWLLFRDSIPLHGSSLLKCFFLTCIPNINCCLRIFPLLGSVCIKRIHMYAHNHMYM